MSSVRMMTAGPAVVICVLAMILQRVIVAFLTHYNENVTPRAVRLIFFAAGVALAYWWFLPSHKNDLNVDPYARGVIEKARRR